jgi:hypothetical protein
MKANNLFQVIASRLLRGSSDRQHHVNPYSQVNSRLLTLRDSPASRQEFERRTEARRLAPGQEESLKALRRGWCLGSEEFKEQKLEAIDGQVRQHHFGQMRLELAQAKAERIISEELRRLNWPEAQLALRRKRDPAKLEIAVRLRRETTLSVKEIAARLHLGTPASASLCLLAALKKANAGATTQGWLGI